ncbi:hypothetical protein [Nocardia alni]|nr:hypothetical protein [Nocardia alni]
MRETLDVLSDASTVADIRESQETDEYSTSEEIAALMARRRGQRLA